MNMSLVSAITDMKQSNIQMSAGTRILKMAMDQQTAEGTQITDLLQTASVQAPVLGDPDLGQNIDVYI